MRSLKAIAIGVLLFSLVYPFPLSAGKKARRGKKGQKVLATYPIPEVGGYCKLCHNLNGFTRTSYSYRLKRFLYICRHLRLYTPGNSAGAVTFAGKTIRYALSRRYLWFYQFCSHIRSFAGTIDVCSNI